MSAGNVTLMSDIVHVMVSKDYEDMFNSFIRSLQTYSKFKIHLVELISKEPFKLKYSFKEKEKRKVKFADWNNKLLQVRIASLLDFNYKQGDRVLVLDVDLLFKCNPFEVFDKFRGDLLLSTRDHENEYPVIACFWGFVYSRNIENFLYFIYRQAMKPNWEPLIKFRKKQQHIGYDWWIDQDILCTVYKEGYRNLRVSDIGWQYSYDINHKKNKGKEGLKKELEAKVLHTKKSKDLRNIK